MHEQRGNGMQAKNALLVVYLYFRIPGDTFQANFMPDDKAVDRRVQGEYIQQDVTLSK